MPDFQYKVFYLPIGGAGVNGLTYLNNNNNNNNNNNVLAYYASKNLYAFTKILYIYTYYKEVNHNLKKSSIK